MKRVRFADEPPSSDERMESATNMLTAIFPCVQWEHVHLAGVLAAGSYAAASIALSLMNKSVLSEYNFPDSAVIITGQMVCTVVAMGLLGHFGILDVQPFNWEKIWSTRPLAFTFCVNAFTTLASLRGVSIPMYTTLRRTAILLTIAGEYYMFKTVPTSRVTQSIVIAMLGSLIAGFNDLAFDLHAYTLIFVANFCGVAHLLMTKRVGGALKLSNQELLYGCNILALPFALVIMALLADFDALRTFTYWSDPAFMTGFMACLFMGAVLNRACDAGVGRGE